MEASRRIVRGTAAYTAGAVLQRALNFLLLPLFTAILSPTEFGQIGVITTIAAALSVLLSFGLETAVFRGYSRAARQPGGPAAFVNTVGVFGVAAPALIAAAFSLAGAPAIADAFDVPVDALRLATLGAAATAGATLLPMAILRAQERLRDYLHLTGLQVAVTPSLTILFVVVLGQGVFGWMAAYALSSLVLLIRALAILHHRWSLEFNAGDLRSALAFGLPLVPHALSHWGLSVSDRAILGAFVPAGQVGVYYLAYLLCLPVSLVAIALSQATQPLFADAGRSRTHHRDLGRVIDAQFIAVVFVAISVSLLGPPATLLFLSRNYVEAASLIPWLAAGSALFGLYLIPIAAIALVAERPERVWMITTLAAGSNIALNLFFVPQFGTLAAAVNTMIGYGVLLVGVFLYMRRVCEPALPYDGGRIASGVLMIGVPAAIAAALTESDSLLGLALRSLVMVGCAAVLLVGPFRREAGAVMRAFRPSNARNLA